MCGCPGVSTHYSSPGWAGESWNRVCLPPQASLALHLCVGGGQRAQAADNTPGQAGKWQGKGRLLVSLQHGLSPGALGCLSPWLPPSRCLGYHPFQADVRDGMWESCAALGCGSPGCASLLPAWDSPALAARFIPGTVCSLDGPKLQSRLVSPWQLGLPLCRSEGCPLLFCSTSMLLCTGTAHSELVVAVAGWRCWQPCWQVWVGTGRCPHRAAVRDLPRADGHWLSLLFTCKGSAAAVLGAAAFVLMPQGVRRVRVSSKGSCTHPIAQSSLQVGKAGQEPWESIRRDG